MSLFPHNSKVLGSSLFRILSLFPLNPFRGFLRMSLHLLLVRQQLLHLMRRRHMPPFLHSFPPQHPLLPRFQIRELVDFHPCPSSSRHPAPVRNVSNRALVSDQIAGFGRGKVLV